MTSPRLAGATAVNNNGGHLPEPTDGYGQAPAVGSNDTPRHAPYMPRPDVAAREWVQDVLAHTGPIYLRIVNSLERTVRRGGLAPGQRLPSQRALALQLGVDLTTVTRAFDEARKRGLIEARGPQGSFIAPPKAGFEQVVDLSMNVPPVPDADALAETLRRGAAAVLARSNAPNLMTYHLGGGNPTDRHAAARWLRPMLGTVDDACLLLTEGAQVALAAILLSQSRDGDAILCDTLVYPGLLQAAAALGRRLLPVDSDEHGMCPEALARQARESGARLVYLNPTCQNPTALTLPLQRREALARVLESEGLLAIEDDPYWHLAEDAPTALATLAPRHVFYVATLSKVISPGLRTAFVQCPDAAHAESMTAALRATRLMGHPLVSALASQLLLDGSAQALLAQVRNEARERLRMARYLLAPSLLVRAEGLHAWCRVPAPWTDATLVRTAQLQGLAIAPSSAFCPPGVLHQNGVRLSLGLAADRRQLESALRRIDRLLLSDALPAIER
ncbi:PLP-dependent aminotransferase family protein [Stenotrophomonas maltophilia]|uniref:aminotransferase-like domain-containing protein n=1 Tax=Stenotrophomonas maltophilia group TaxID=995085 RepID=UPI0015DF33CC|nr:PLP-dependent aminotransferase family protein [Stenotrophomonas maltophilia]MBA0434555.1 PLP-dependent aminotransferase family protein [Stenotrophomonas maltophilia]MDZ5814153.1 PLP-dependent aminotransferase family protein [Stenotrophomonas maltophilia]